MRQLASFHLEKSSVVNESWMSRPTNSTRTYLRMRIDLISSTLNAEVAYGPRQQPNGFRGPMFGSRSKTDRPVYGSIETQTEHLSAGRSTLPLLSLYVHQNNAAAIRLYQQFGFTPEPAVRTNDHILMLQKLNTGSSK